MKYLIKTCRDGRDQRQRAYNLVCSIPQPHSRKVYLRGVKSVSTCYLTPTASTTSTTSANWAHQGNQGRVLSISVEQKYRVLHRRCGGVCVRDGCESNDGVVYRDKSNRFVHKKNTAKARRRRRKNVSSLFGTRVDASRRWQTLPTARARAASSSERCCDFRFF